MNAITSDDVLRIIRTHPHIPTVAEIAAALRVDSATVREHLAALREQGRVQPMPERRSA